MIYLGLFLSFFQIGLFAFGGGLATIPFLESLSRQTSWFSSLDVINMIAISEATPGPLGINMATYVGFITSGVLGAIVAVLGLVIPSIVVIVCVSKLLEYVKNNVSLKRIFYGLRASSVALVFLAFFEALKTTSLDLNAYTGITSLFDVVHVFPICLSILIFYGIKKWKLHPICYIILAFLIGTILGL